LHDVFSSNQHYEYFSSLNRDKDEGVMGIRVTMETKKRRICTYSSPFSYPIEKNGYYPYLYLYPYIVEIFC